MYNEEERAVAKAIGREIAMADVAVAGGWLRAARAAIEVIEKFEATPKHSKDAL